MATKNSRVAAYLPPVLKEKFDSFKSDRGIRGDSQALTEILSEFFGVSHQIAHRVGYQSFATVDRVETLEAELSELAASMQKLQASFSSARLLSDRVQRMDARIDAIESERKTEIRVEQPPSKRQMSLLELDQIDNSPQNFPVQNNSLVDKEWLTTKECWEQLETDLSYETFRKFSPDRLREYGVEGDLQRKAEDKHNPRWLRLTQPQSRVTLLSEGSEQSREADSKGF